MDDQTAEKIVEAINTLHKSDVRENLVFATTIYMNLLNLGSYLEDVDGVDDDTAEIISHFMTSMIASVCRFLDVEAEEVQQTYQKLMLHAGIEPLDFEEITLQ